MGQSFSGQGKCILNRLVREDFYDSMTLSLDLNEKDLTLGKLEGGKTQRETHKQRGCSKKGLEHLEGILISLQCLLLSLFVASAAGFMSASFQLEFGF